MDGIETQNCRLVDFKAVAKMLSLSPRTVWRYRSAGRLPKPVTISGSVRWRLADIDRWIEWGCPSQREFEARKSDSERR
jgi:predicted DNA-binding transcriptional regulator AlpA